MDSTPATTGPATAELAGTSGLRSCRFCRTRGLHCSGHAVCDACRAHNVECAYEAYGGGHQPGKPQYNPPRTEILSGYASPGPSLASTAATPSEASGSQRMLFEELEQIAHRLFLPSHIAPAAELQRSGYWPGAATRELGPTGLKLPYRDVFVGLAQSIVELFLIRFDSLGCSPREHTTLAHLSTLVFQHQAPPSFGTFAPPIAPQSFSEYEVQQLIQVWFAHHPLSFVLSKTLLLQSYRNGTHDPELLALVLAEAAFFTGAQDLNTAEAFFEAARARVLERPALSLSTTQALTLLGWHDFCLDRPRQGYCYLEFARMIAAQYLSESRRASSSSSPPADHHMNGVNIQAVETELSQRIFWFASAIVLWVSLHQSSPNLDVLSPLDTPASSPSPSSSSSSSPLPPADLSSSAVYALDETSGNIASLVAQQTGVRELWALAHLASAIGPLFRQLLCGVQDHHHQQQQLLLRGHRAGSGSSSPPPPYEYGNNTNNYYNYNWTGPPPTTPPLTLTSTPSSQQQQQQQQPLRSRIRSLLADARSRLPAQLDHSNPAQTFAWSAFQVLAVHTAFWPGGGDGIVVGTVHAGDVFHAIQTFLAATQTLQRQAALQDLFGGRDHDVRTAPWVVLGLDTCGRAVGRLLLAGSDGSSSSSSSSSSGKKRTSSSSSSPQQKKAIQDVADRVWEASKHQKLANEPGLARVRERLARLVGEDGGVVASALLRDRQQREHLLQQTTTPPPPSLPPVLLPSHHHGSGGGGGGGGGSQELWTGGVEGLEVTWSGAPDMSSFSVSSSSSVVVAETPELELMGEEEGEGYYGGWDPVMY